MISRAQQILLKRAQQQAGIEDADYREAIETVTAIPGCRSSRDKRLTDRHVDNLLSYFEAIYWRKVDLLDPQVIQRCAGLNDVFRARGYWASKNTRGNTSRDRYTAQDLSAQISVAEDELCKLGYGFAYVQAIQNNCRSAGRLSLPSYLGALQRTLASKRRPQPAGNVPLQ
jgi:hypothetical protein